ncbi:hypothetical protein CDCA_CDCA05G1582 [Cyanidium caldarium]|uniref:Uncharacterized protein n=1 Tax=Cyanidium caldarium TaxID=2771 RepID=A0AAV9ITB3_CYACA|nr:hypothetical protein CDCA_CDCA05G1582 [Cyanidium caldarium]
MDDPHVAGCVAAARYPRRRIWRRPVCPRRPLVECSTAFTCRKRAGEHALRRYRLAVGTESVLRLSPFSTAPAARTEATASASAAWRPVEERVQQPVKAGAGAWRAMEGEAHGGAVSRSGEGEASGGRAISVLEPTRRPRAAAESTALPQLWRRHWARALADAVLEGAAAADSRSPPASESSSAATGVRADRSPVAQPLREPLQPTPRRVADATGAPGGAGGMSRPRGPPADFQRVTVYGMSAEARPPTAASTVWGVADAARRPQRSVATETEKRGGGVATPVAGDECTSSFRSLSSPASPATTSLPSSPTAYRHPLDWMHEVWRAQARSITTQTGESHPRVSVLDGEPRWQAVEVDWRSLQHQRRHGSVAATAVAASCPTPLYGYNGYRVELDDEHHRT